MLLKGKDQEARERIEVARWLAFRIYLMSPYIKPPKAQTVTQYVRFPWEDPTPEEVEKKAPDCTVTEEEKAVLNNIFAQLRKQREET